MHDEPTDSPEQKPGRENDNAPATDAPPAEGGAAFDEIEETENSGEAEDGPEEDAAGEPDDDEENAGEDADEDGEDGEPDERDLPSLPMTAVVEALLFAAREPLKPAQIARAVGRRTRQDAVRAAVDELNVQYLETARAFEIAEISGRFQLMSRPEYAEHIMRIYPKRELTDKESRAKRLTPAMLDTLAIVAYRQPVMRSEIEHIRGVPCGPALRSLIERGSVREIGRRSDLVGKPAVFGTTERFLAEFGLGSIEELPMRSEFIAAGPAPQVEMAAPQEDAAPEPETGGERGNAESGDAIEQG